MSKIIYATATRSALTSAHADLSKMDKNAADFRGDGVWTWRDWEQWIVAEQSRLNLQAAPSSK